MAKTDERVALEIMEEAAAKLEPLWDYIRGRPLGWLNSIIDGALEELRWKVEREEEIREAHRLWFEKRNGER